MIRFAQWKQGARGYLIAEEGVTYRCIRQNTWEADDETVFCGSWVELHEFIERRPEWDWTRHRFNEQGYQLPTVPLGKPRDMWGNP